jgi:hypothetical protein
MNKKTVLVRFGQDSKEYAYLTDLELEVDDYAIVDTGSRDGFGYHTVKITQVQGLLENQRLSGVKWIVQVLDVNNHITRLKKQKIAQEIRNQLAERKSALDEILIYERLAKDDPAINKLLNELAEVDDTAKILLPKPESDEKIK